mmetsp:Transcript_76255/g.191947  ORF Transcript_76255/g.191947 Transcript_76255/m.191947 type:complete len:250 (+) Transcript_76255:1229-1978(+)
MKGKKQPSAHIIQPSPESTPFTLQSHGVTSVSWASSKLLLRQWRTPRVVASSKLLSRMNSASSATFACASWPSNAACFKDGCKAPDVAASDRGPSSATPGEPPPGPTTSTRSCGCACQPPPPRLDAFQSPAAEGKVPGSTLPLLAQPLASQSSLRLVFPIHHEPSLGMKYNHLSLSSRSLKTGGVPTASEGCNSYIPLIDAATSPTAPEIRKVGVDCNASTAPFQAAICNGSTSSSDFALIFRDSDVQR